MHLFIILNYELSYIKRVSVSAFKHNALFNFMEGENVGDVCAILLPNFRYIYSYHEFCISQI